MRNTTGEGADAVGNKEGKTLHVVSMPNSDRQREKMKMRLEEKTMPRVESGWGSGVPDSGGKFHVLTTLARNAERGPWILKAGSPEDRRRLVRTFRIYAANRVQLVQAKKSRPSEIGQISCE